MPYNPQDCRKLFHICTAAQIYGEASIPNAYGRAAAGSNVPGALLCQSIHFHRGQLCGRDFNKT